MSDRWYLPTLRSAPVEKAGTKAERMAELTRRLRAGEPVSDQVTCACRRVVSADVMVDLRSVSAETRAVWKLPELACDGCLTRAYRQGTVAPDVLAAALGAPLATVDRLRAKVLARARATS